MPIIQPSGGEGRRTKSLRLSLARQWVWGKPGLHETLSQEIKEADNKCLSEHKHLSLKSNTWNPMVKGRRDFYTASPHLHTQHCPLACGHPQPVLLTCRLPLRTFQPLFKVMNTHIYQSCHWLFYGLFYKTALGVFFWTLVCLLT